MIRRLLKMVRFSEWGSTKLFECFMAVFVGCQGQSGCIGPANLVASFCFVASYLALGYFINDLSDQPADKKIGKDRGIHHLTDWGIFIVGIALGTANIVSLAIMSPLHKELFVVGIILSYVVMLGYSLPPLRFKERGFAGVIMAAVGQRTLPALVLIASLHNIHVSVLIYMAFLTVNGLRWIVIHQVLDLDNDARAGIKTYAAGKSARILRCVMFFIIFPSEVTLGFVLTFCFMDTTLFYPLLAYWLVMPLFTLLWSRNIGPVSLFSYDYAPGGNFLFLVMPLVILPAFAIGNPIGLAFLAVFLLIKGGYIHWQFRNVVALSGIVWSKGLVIR